MRVGVDEAGRGPVIGPLVVAAVAADDEGVALIRALGATDSKALNHYDRERIAKGIEMGEEEGWCISSTVVASAERLDRMMALESLNDIEVVLFGEAVRGLELDGDYIARGGVLSLDACDVDEARFGNRIQANLGAEWSHWSVRSEHALDARDSLVGAASIVAKVVRDASIREIEEEIGFDIGSGYPSDPATIAALPRLVSGKAPHTEVRWAWATTARAWEQAHDTPLPKRPAPSGGRIGNQTTLDLF